MSSSPVPVFLAFPPQKEERFLQLKTLNFRACRALYRAYIRDINYVKDVGFRIEVEEKLETTVSARVSGLGFT